MLVLMIHWTESLQQRKGQEGLCPSSKIKADKVLTGAGSKQMQIQGGQNESGR